MNSIDDFYDLLRSKSESLQNEFIDSDLLTSCSNLALKSNLQKSEDVAVQLRKYYSLLAYAMCNKLDKMNAKQEIKTQTKEILIPDFSIENAMKYNPEIFRFWSISVIPYYFNYFLTANRTQQYFNMLKKLTPDQFEVVILPLLYSPFSINFFRQSFREALMPYFICPSASPNLTDIVTAVINKMNENMHLCPHSLIEFFAIDDFKERSKEVLKTKILAPFFGSNPFPLFSLFNFNQSSQQIFSENFIDNLQQSIFANIFDNNRNPTIKFNYLNESHTFQMISDSTIISQGKIPNPYELYRSSSKLTKPVSRSQLKEKLSVLLRISPRLPAKLPNFLKTKSPLEIIETLILRDGPQYYYRLNLYNEVKIKFDLENKTVDEIISILSNLDDKIIRGQEMDLKTITEYTELLSIISGYTSNVYDYFHSATFYEQYKKDLARIVSNIEFTSPQNFTDGFVKNYSYYQDVPAFYNAYAQSMTLSAFNASRPSLHSNDSAFCTSMKLYPYGPTKRMKPDEQKATINFINAIQRIINSGMANFGQLFKLASNFISAFTEDNNAFEKCKCIIKQYNNLKKSIELRADSNTQMLINCNEKLFTFILFETICPPNFVSVYVFLHDYLGPQILNALSTFPGYDSIVKTKEMLNSIIIYKLDISFHLLSLCRLSPQQTIPQVKVKPTDSNISLISLYMVNDYMMFSAKKNQVKNQQQLFIEKLNQLVKKSQTNVVIKMLDQKSLEIYSLEIILSQDGSFELPQTRSTLLKFLTQCHK